MVSEKKDDAINKLNDDEQEDAVTNYTALGISFGVAFGSALGGLVFDDMITGVGVGLCLGMVIGGLLDSKKSEE